MRIEVIVLVRVLVGMICPLAGTPLEVAHGLLLELLLGYSPSEVVSLVGGGNLVEYFSKFLEGRCLLVI